MARKAFDVVRGLRPWAGALALVATVGCAPAPYEGPPCVVVCVVDTLRADHTSLLGYDRGTTPNLEALAREGTVFERAWSSCSWTLPSVSMLLTGRARSDNGRDLSPEHASLAERLSDEGYRTYGVTANALLLAADGWDRGFDRYQVYEHPADGRRARGWSGEEVVDRAIAMLDDHPRDEPFFLFCLLFDPHDPYTPVDGQRFEARRSLERFEAFGAAVEEDERELWDERAYAGIESRIANYDSEVWEADRALGRLFRHLDERGFGERTYAVVTSDHGEGLWTRRRPRGEPPKESNFFPPLYMDHGLMLHTEQVHVPLVVRGPGLPAGTRVARDVSLLDVVPTLGRLLDLPGTDRLDGLDLFEVPAAASIERAIPGFTSRGGSVLHEGRFRLHLPSPTRVERFGAENELFDLERDPGERTPIVDRELESRLEAAFAQWYERGRVSTRARSRTEADRVLLEALGYTAGETEQR